MLSVSFFAFTLLLFQASVFARVWTLELRRFSDVSFQLNKSILGLLVSSPRSWILRVVFPFSQGTRMAASGMKGWHLEAESWEHLSKGISWYLLRNRRHSGAPETRFTDAVAQRSHLAPPHRIHVPSNLLRSFTLHSSCKFLSYLVL